MCFVKSINYCTYRITQFVRTTIIFSIFFFLFIPHSFSQIVEQDFSTLQAEFWVEQYRFPSLDDPQEITNDDLFSERITELLEQARVYFSAMIFGYNFTYVPLDRRREVEEFFEIEPIYQIRWGDPSLEYLDTRITNNDVFMRFRYFPKDYERDRLYSWDRISQADSQGVGSVFYGPRASVRQEALEEAVKQAIRNYARTVIATKPKEIQGIFVLSEAPRSYVLGADFVTEVKIRLQIDSVLSYQNF
jgi:hypothetical protein